MQNVEIYIQADRQFYEDPRRWRPPPGHPAEGEFAVTARECPPGWTRTERGLWRYVFPEHPELPEQGWKIHVSATVDNGDALCAAVWDYCTAQEMPFKYLLNPGVQFLCNSKYAPRGSSGKLATLYPRGEAELEAALSDLSHRVKGHAGPHILSDLRWEDGPLYVRYGAFADLTCTDADGAAVPAIRRPDGALVPDERRPVFAPPPWVRLPGFLQSQLQALRGDGERQPYRVEKALHFSNSGGVYLARRLDDGSQVVLKEARPHAGVDANGDDAVRRQDREEWALRRLDGIEGIPRLLGRFTLGGHSFLVQEYRDGLQLYSWGAAYHPLATMAAPTAEEIEDFTRRTLRILGRVQDIVAAVHARGLAIGDLHTSNVLVGPDDAVSVIDFEQAFEPSDSGWRPALAAPGFAAPNRRGTDIDDYALAMVQLSAFLAFGPVLALDAGKVAEYTGLVRRLFPVPPDWPGQIAQRLATGAADLPAGPPSPRDVETGLVGGILASATPEREDRLFPGDIQQFTVGGSGFAHGAAGVLWALDTGGHGRFPELEEWLRDAARSAERPHPGFYDGAGGVAYVLDHLGYPEDAAELLEGCRNSPRGGISLFSGLSGIGANLLHFAERRGDERGVASALGIADQLADYVAAGTGPDRTGSSGKPRGSRIQAGLMRGWSGAALFFARLYEHTGDPACLDTALTALHRDLDQCIPNDDGALLVEHRGVIGLPHIEAGGMGLALAADEVLAHREDDRLRDAAPRLLRPGFAPITVRGDLLFGKAGQLAALARLSGDTEAIRRRAAELPRYLAAYRGHLALASGRGFRLSMDLATGSAGVLLALAAERGGGAPFLPFFRARGRAGQEGSEK